MKTKEKEQTIKEIEIKDTFDRLFLVLGRGKHKVEVIEEAIWSKNNPVEFSLIKAKRYKMWVRSDRLKELKEKYFICIDCGNLNTWSNILRECENGGQGLCSCEFCVPFWSKKFNCIEIDTLRIYNDYIEISKDLFEKLKLEHNEVLRLRAFNCVPKDKLLSYENYKFKR